jgi:hypothetical protein
MCKHTITTYQKCAATFTYTILCTSYINDDTEDLDVQSCPNFHLQEIHHQGGACTCVEEFGGKCVRKGENTWSVEERRGGIEWGKQGKDYARWKEEMRGLWARNEYRCWMRDVDLEMVDVWNREVLDRGEEVKRLGRAIVELGGMEIDDDDKQERLKGAWAVERAARIAAELDAESEDGRDEICGLLIAA